MLSLVKVVPRLVATNHGGVNGVWQLNNCYACTAVSKDMAKYDQPLTNVVVEPIPNGVDTERFSADSRASTASEAGSPSSAGSGEQRRSSRRISLASFVWGSGLLAKSGVRLLWVADAHNLRGWEPFEQARHHTSANRAVESRGFARGDAELFYRDVAASHGVQIGDVAIRGLGLAAAEAAACGLTTVAPDVMGLRESVIEGITGVHFPYAASDDVVAQMILDWIGKWTPGRY